ncbi:hypothetical protein BDV37DRAFT_280040 [Aspergillus pseudonomiae]|uniref:Uncharacterized protein n=1 Tax=Aspergillus pseudonomiae TaxID=1506151 RepID=A0A5N7DM22_9EURO|nr:uncharacterized protein BDV37DRAFT_280040 [Aspergillus pseudonomiae]KAE8407507.1 hypothetical protein BDV37DRAFT_280040 [Aspergillus pseudonomiae]
MRRQIIWDATGDAFEFERRTKKFKVCFLPVPMPTKDERFLWVDLTFPVRAVYLPVARIADQRVPRFAAYVHLNLRIYDVSLQTYRPHHVPIEKVSSTVGKTLGGVLGPTSQTIGQTLGEEVGGVAQNVVDGQYVPGTEKPVPEPNLTEAERDKIQQKEGAPRTYWAGNLSIKADQTHGWGWRPEWTMRIDARALIEMLIVPMHFRKRIYINPYRYVKLFHATAIDNTGVATITLKVMDAWVAIDYAGLVSRHGGIPLDYKATGIPESSITQILLAILTPKASMLPVAGTVLSLGLGYLAEYLDDPQAMLTKHSLAKKGTEIALLFIQGANRVRKYYASGKIPAIQLPRRGPGMRQALQGQDRQSIFVGEEGEKAQAQQMVRDEKTIGVTIDEIEDPQREVDMEDDEEMQAVTWLGYSPLVIEKQ